MHMQDRRLWRETVDGLCSIVADTNFVSGTEKCFWFCSETFCVRNKCFPVCAAQCKKHHGQQCVRNNVYSFARALRDCWRQNLEKSFFSESFAVLNGEFYMKERLLWKKYQEISKNTNRVISNTSRRKSHKAHHSRAYLSFYCLKWLKLFLLPLDGMPVHRRVIPQH